MGGEGVGVLEEFWVPLAVPCGSVGDEYVSGEYVFCGGGDFFVGAGEYPVVDSAVGDPFCVGGLDSGIEVAVVEWFGHFDECDAGVGEGSGSRCVVWPVDDYYPVWLGCGEGE